MAVRARDFIAWGLLATAARMGELPLLHFSATPEQVAREAAGLVYLATPYSREVIGPDGTWDYPRSLDAQARASFHARALAQRGITAVSPIVLSADMCHLRPEGEAPLDALDAGFWQRWCAPILHAARAVVVPDIRGWDRSAGIWHEVCVAVGMNLPVYIYAGGKE